MRFYYISKIPIERHKRRDDLYQNSVAVYHSPRCEVPAPRPGSHHSKEVSPSISRASGCNSGSDIESDDIYTDDDAKRLWRISGYSTKRDTDCHKTKFRIFRCNLYKLNGNISFYFHANMKIALILSCTQINVLYEWENTANVSFQSKM